MKTLLFLLIFIPSILNAQLNIYVGDSELKGLVGMEAQIHNFSISGGWRPNKVFPDYYFNSYSGSLNYYLPPINEYYFYLSGGITSKGITHMEFYTPVPEPSFIALIGLRGWPNMYAPKVSKRWKYDAGIGINTTGSITMFSFEVLINFTIIK
jgi:hypothetical protein